jgi:UDP-galactopyranose mutase
MKVDYLIVGAGYTGSVLAERIASVLNKKVMLVEKRNHIAGNAYDYYDQSGVLIHKYGPHIFHTNSKKVWRYLSGFTKWRPYYHKTLAVVEGNHIPIPFNLNSIYECFPGKYAEKMEQALINEFGYGKKIPILKLRENGNKELAFLADYIYKHVFLGYTQKQWDLTPEELDASVTARVPVSITRDNRYFSDTYQAMPVYGYTAMFKNILDHKNIRVLLNTDYKEIIEEITFNRLIYTGPIDSYFDNMHGELPYRSLRFEFKNFEQTVAQPTGIVTYPSDYNYTRITEFKYLTGQVHHSTTVAFEYPQAHVPDKTEPYYPIPREQNRIIYNQYHKEALNLNGSVVFAGRLADYMYYNMDQVVARALSVFKNQIQSERIDQIKASLI